MEGSVPHQDRLRTRRVTEAIAQFRPTGRKLVTTVSTPRPVAESDIPRRGNARRAWGIDARRSAGVYVASTAADIVDALVAVGDGGRLALGEFFARGANKGDVGVGRVEPVIKLLIGEEIGWNLVFLRNNIERRAITSMRSGRDGLLQQVLR